MKPVWCFPSSLFCLFLISEVQYFNQKASFWCLPWLIYFDYSFSLMFNNFIRLYLDIYYSRIIILGMYEVPFWLANSSFTSVKFSCIIFQNIYWFYFFKPQWHQLSLALTIFVLHLYHSLSACFHLFGLFSLWLSPQLILFFSWVYSISFSCF